MSSISWQKNVDEALAQAKAKTPSLPILLDFSAAPM